MQSPIYDDRHSTYEELHNKNKLVTIHHENFKELATELPKINPGLAPGIMNGIFKIRDVKYNFRYDFSVATGNVKSVRYG